MATRSNGGKHLIKDLVRGRLYSTASIGRAYNQTQPEMYDLLCTAGLLDVDGDGFGITERGLDYSPVQHCGVFYWETSVLEILFPGDSREVIEQ
ncbi:ArnR1-like winged helix-turn-helix domain-containing protein [Parendozoicomonas haliclonae]|uniref:Uncharacterized protein n=1 Tax=Parendozoicomonas haliclonae TaxID=1960125 RepID=A0A1X7AE57_9GAMM|nr:hypothetical protein EHSB41UT_00278 [Parendozoicomonas haliclonae]